MIRSAIKALVISAVTIALVVAGTTQASAAVPNLKDPVAQQVSASHDLQLGSPSVGTAETLSATGQIRIHTTTGDVHVLDTGRNGIDVYWWGEWDLYLSNDATNALVALLDVGAATAKDIGVLLGAFGVTLPEGISAELVGVIAWVGAQALRWCNDGRGVGISNYWGCWAQ